MNYLISIIIISFTFCAYYDIGDTVSYAHQNELFDVCYGNYPFEELKLLDFNDKISIFGR